MRFQASGLFEQGVADIDPIAAPENILETHFLLPKAVGRKVTDRPEALYLALIGTGVESVTLDLYALIEDLPVEATSASYKVASTRWFQFATGLVVTNGTLATVTSSLPAGGTIYARRTADTITAGQTRPLLMSWVSAKQ